MKNDLFSFSFCFSLIISATLNSCSLPSESQPWGHYEDSSAGEMKVLASQQRIVPEYAPSQAVFISYPLLDEFDQYQMVNDILSSGVEKIWLYAPHMATTLKTAAFRRLRSEIGENLDDESQKIVLVRQDFVGELTSWARDYAPLSAKTPDGEMRFIDQNYYQGRMADDLAPKTLSDLFKIKRVSVPIYNEGGNFMISTKGDCFMTDRVLAANNSIKGDSDKLLDTTQISEIYRDYLGCWTVKIFPRLPFEGTGHIDMWAKLMSDETMIVAEIKDEILLLAGYTDEQRLKVEAMQKFLNERTLEIEKMGYRVVRIPNPAPIFSLKSEQFDLYRSYTNSLILNHTVLVPRYVTPARRDTSAVGGQYIDKHLLLKYETLVKETYENLGFTLLWEVTDNMIASGGSVHCATMQIPTF